MGKVEVSLRSWHMKMLIHPMIRGEIKKQGREKEVERNACGCQ